MGVLFQRAKGHHVPSARPSQTLAWALTFSYYSPAPFLS